MESDSDEECFEKIVRDGDGDFDGQDDEEADNGNANNMGFDLTGILFGNIDSEGKLVDEGDNNAFDGEFKNSMASLGR